MSLGRKLPIWKDGRDRKPFWSEQAPFAGENADGEAGVTWGDMFTGSKPWIPGAVLLKVPGKAFL